MVCCCTICLRCTLQFASRVYCLVVGGDVALYARERDIERDIPRDCSPIVIIIISSKYDEVCSICKTCMHECSSCPQYYYIGLRAAKNNDSTQWDFELPSPLNSGIKNEDVLVV